MNSVVSILNGFKLLTAAGVTLGRSEPEMYFQPPPLPAPGATSRISVSGGAGGSKLTPIVSGAGPSGQTPAARADAPTAGPPAPKALMVLPTPVLGILVDKGPAAAEPSPPSDPAPSTDTAPNRVQLPALEPARADVEAEPPSSGRRLKDSTRKESLKRLALSPPQVKANVERTNLEWGVGDPKKKGWGSLPMRRGQKNSVEKLSRAISAMSEPQLEAVNSAASRVQARWRGCQQKVMIQEYMRHVYSQPDLEKAKKHAENFLPKDRHGHLFPLTAPLKAFHPLGCQVALYLHLLHWWGAFMFVASLLCLPSMCTNMQGYWLNTTDVFTGLQTIHTLGNADELTLAHGATELVLVLLMVWFMFWQRYDTPWCGAFLVNARHYSNTPRLLFFI